MRARPASFVWVALALILFAAGCGDSDDEAAPPSTTTSSQAADPAPTTSAAPDDRPAATEVEVHERTLVDTSRVTPRSGDEPEQAERTLVTRIHHRSEGGPYPLIVFSHGLGASPDSYDDLASAWASAGFVVAVPAFPLSNRDAPAGPDGSDVANQPGDVSFVIDELIAAAEDDGDPLSGLVDGERLGAAGHSNGGITTLGLVSNTCCRDQRIDAAIAIAGTPAPFRDGEYDFGQTPPMLMVHGTDDRAIAYTESVEVANQVVAPRGVLTIVGGDHSSYLRPAADAYDAVAEATVAFWQAYLLDDGDALDLLPGAEQTPEVTMHFTTDTAGPLSVPTTAPPTTDRKAQATPTDDLVDGQTVTVSWSGYLPGQVVNIVQCANGGTEGAELCELATAKILQPNPTGEGSLDLEIVVGPVGTGACGPDEPPCVITVNDAGLQDPDATVRIPIMFADDG